MTTALPTVPSGEHLARVRTPMQTIDLERLKDGEVALYLDGFIQFVSGHDDQAYHGALASKPASILGSGVPIRALILGGGDGLAARNLLRLPNVAEVVMVEIDRGMLDFCSTNPIVRGLNQDVFRNQKLKVKVGDARAFVRSTPTRLFDLAVVDFPDPVPSILDLYRWPFYSSLLRHMNPQRHVISVQASGEASPVAQYVTANLRHATGNACQCITFSGKNMDGGKIVVARRGC